MKTRWSAPCCCPTGVSEASLSFTQKFGFQQFITMVKSSCDYRAYREDFDGSSGLLPPIWSRSAGNNFGSSPHAIFLDGAGSARMEYNYYPWFGGVFSSTSFNRCAVLLEEPAIAYVDNFTMQMRWRHENTESWANWPFLAIASGPASPNAHLISISFYKKKSTIFGGYDINGMSVYGQDALNFYGGDYYEDTDLARVPLNKNGYNISELTLTAIQPASNPTPRYQVRCLLNTQLIDSWEQPFVFMNGSFPDYTRQWLHYIGFDHTARTSQQGPYGTSEIDYYYVQYDEVLY